MTPLFTRRRYGRITFTSVRFVMDHDGAVLVPSIDPFPGVVPSQSWLAEAKRAIDEGRYTTDGQA